MYDILNKFIFPKNDKRKNILNYEGEVYRGFVLGQILLRPYWQQIKGCKTMPTRLLDKQKYKILFEETMKYFYHNSPEPDFKYSSIQYNKNHKCNKHIDKNNVGDSYIIGFGDYTGGRLIIYDENNNKEYIDIQNKFYKFNGSKFYHETEEFEGDRYSLVFFNIINYDKNKI